MTRIRVSTRIDAPPSRVWREVRDLASHVEWMADAEAIRFTTPRREGVGTAFECDTRVGPFRLTDRMVVTEWQEGRAIGIRHSGVVTGEGHFRLRRRRVRGTTFTWSETLRFPWWTGGHLGGAVGALVLRRIWQGNLERLRMRIER